MTQKSLYSPCTSCFLICDLVPPQFCHWMQDLYCHLPSLFLLKKDSLWSWVQMCIWFSYGQWQKWIMLLNKAKNEDFSYGNMSKLRLFLCTLRSSSKIFCGPPKRHLMPCTAASQSTTPKQSHSYRQKKWTSFCNEPCGSLSTGGESNMEMYREQKKASEVERIEVVEVRRFWCIENGNKGDIEGN